MFINKTPVLFIILSHLPVLAEPVSHETQPSIYLWKDLVCSGPSTFLHLQPQGHNRQKEKSAPIVLDWLVLWAERIVNIFQLKKNTPESNSIILLWLKFHCLDKQPRWNDLALRRPFFKGLIYKWKINK